MRCRGQKSMQGFAFQYRAPYFDGVDQARFMWYDANLIVATIGSSPERHKDIESPKCFVPTVPVFFIAVHFKSSCITALHMGVVPNYGSQHGGHVEPVEPEK